MAVFISALKSQGFLDQIHITVGIVGSRKLLDDDDYGSKGWAELGSHLTIYGFDADADACDAANLDLGDRQIDWHEHHIPLAFAQTVGTANLYVTNSPSLSSLYPPNEQLTNRFVGAENIRVDFELEVETTTLNEFCKIENITFDFLQIDVQGADLDVLKGASNILGQSVLGVQVEVEFLPLYQGQPLFPEVDSFLQAQGFTLFDLITDNPWCRNTRICSPLRSQNRAGQLLWADACYLRDPLLAPTESMKITPDRLLKLACLADILEFPDYALELLMYLTKEFGQTAAYNVAPAIAASLSQFPELVDQGLENLPVIAGLRDRLV